MRTQNLFTVTHITTADLTGTSRPTYPEYYKFSKGVNVSTQGVATFKLTTQNVTATLQGSITGESDEFVDIKAVSRSGTDVMEGHTVAIFPFMRVKTTNTTSAAVTKVDIAYP